MRHGAVRVYIPVTLHASFALSLPGSVLDALSGSLNSDAKAPARALSGVNDAVANPHALQLYGLHGSRSQAARPRRMEPGR